MFPATTNLYGHANWGSEVAGEVRGRQGWGHRKPYRVSLTEFNELHNTHVQNLENKWDKEQSERFKLEMWGKKRNLVFRGIEGEKDRIKRPRETEVLVRTFLKKVLSFAEDRADNMLFWAVHRLKTGPVGRKSVILRLSSLIDRDEILEKSSKAETGLRI